MMISRRSWAIFVPIPHSSLLLAAVRWLDLLPHNSPERCLVIFTNSAKYADLGPSQYHSARQWLLQHGLISGALSIGVSSPRLRVFEAAVSDAVWFPDADQLVASPSELPLDAIEAADICGLEEDEAFALVRHRHALVDMAIRKRTGDAGELHLVELLRSCTTCQVDHVAMLSDGYGFDIMLSGAAVMNLEVKATTRANQNVLYLSRHEFDTMLRDPRWRLLFLRLDAEMQLESIWTVNSAWIETAAPTDSTPGVVDWQTIRIDVPVRQMAPGLRDIDAAMRETSTLGARLLMGCHLLEARGS
jgi:hypothetical protein